MTIYNHGDGPCYRCLYPECPKANQMMSCRVDGVIGMAPGITGQLLSVQFLKLVLGLESILNKKLLAFNLLTDTYKVLKIRGRRPDCSVCSLPDKNNFDIFAYKYEEFTGSNHETQTLLDNTIPQIKLQDLTPIQLSSVKIIDVRPQEQFNICRITSAQYLKNIPFSKLSIMSIEDIKAQMNIEHFDEPLYIICKAGFTSIKACNLLLKKGFKPVNIEKGLSGYLKAANAEFVL